MCHHRELRACRPQSQLWTSYNNVDWLEHAGPIAALDQLQQCLLVGAVCTIPCSPATQCHAIDHRQRERETQNSMEHRQGGGWGGPWWLTATPTRLDIGYIASTVPQAQIAMLRPGMSSSLRHPGLKLNMPP